MLDYDSVISDNYISRVAPLKNVTKDRRADLAWLFSCFLAEGDNPSGLVVFARDGGDRREGGPDRPKSLDRGPGLGIEQQDTNRLGF